MKYPNDIRASIRRSPAGLRPGRVLLFLLLLLTGLVLPATAQNRKDLIDKRKRLLEEIGKTEGLLHRTQENKAATLDRYFALQTQIQRRQQLVRTLQEEIDFSAQSVERSREVLAALTDDAERLKSEYAAMLRVAYRHKLNRSALLFLFSANSLNDAFRRWQYLRQYERFRLRQADLIVETQQMLRTKTEQLEARLAEKEQLLATVKNQSSLLNRELRDKDQVLKNLKADEGRLVAELERKRRAHEQLNEAIETIIREEVARQRKASRSPDVLAAANTAAAGAGGEFQRRQGSLPWPVNDGEITGTFGTQSHPSLKSVKITNNGIDIRTEARARVFAVFQGQVAGITPYHPNFQHLVILQHGQYYTAYSNLEEVFVKRGEVVDARQAIGRLGSRKPEVHFEIWFDKQKLDPAKWVTKP